MKILHQITFVLLVVGGLNWLTFAFDYDLVAMLLGAGSMLSQIVYILVGLSALVQVFTHMSSCKECEKKV
ncbi:MAG: DUF378 domain-containing protein [Candidatus Jorgensenbacteria bacterium]|nr:DUF378 domain-containing protein [Candidatus Jorgensenbacteria bacterium]